MLFKMKYRILIFMATFTIIFSMITLSAPQNSTKVLLVYNSPGDYGAGTNTIRGISRALAMSGAGVKFEGMNHYPKNGVDGFDCIVVFCPQIEQINQQLLDDLENYNGKIVWMGNQANDMLTKKGITSISVNGKVLDIDSVFFNFGSEEKRYLLSKSVTTQHLIYSQNAKIIGRVTNGSQTVPFAVTDGNITVISITADDNVVYYAVTNIFQNIFNHIESIKFSFYIKLDYVYPISDYELLTKMAQYMKDKGLPFAFVVMPLYENVNLPEMEDYIEVLTFMRDCGGTPIIHCPIINQIEPSPVDMGFRMTRALEIYTQYGIYPAGIEAPEMLLYKPGFEPFFANFSTYFYESGIGKDTWKLLSPASLPSFNGGELQIPAFEKAVGETMSIDGTETNLVQNFLDDTFVDAVKSGQPYTVSIPSWVKFDSFKKTIDLISGMNVVVSNIKSMNHSVVFAAHKLEYTYDWIMLDGKQVENLLYKSHALPKIDDEQQKPMTQISILNNIISAIAGMAIVFFFIAVIWARKLNLRKFMRK